jgi:hypothetical protein
MGQYQQWLHYQEIDRRLRATLDALEQELGQIESQSNGSLQPDMPFANPIISALSAHIATSSNGHALPQDNTDTRNSSSAGEIAGQASNGSVETISAALLHWGELPDFGPQGLHPPDQYEIVPSLSIDHAEIELLPEDMFAFFEEHSQTDPQLELPWWLRKITITSREDDTSKPIDQESIRTNRLVQRWVERWGHQSQGGYVPESESEGIHDEE